VIGSGRGFALAVLLAATWSARARADEDEPEGPHFLARKRSGYVQVFATAQGGAGLRFNNPFRLATQLSSSAEAVSRTAAYAELGVGATLGDPLGLQHGATVRMAFALEGVQQAVLTPSYMIFLRTSGPFAAFARAGVPVVLTPNRTFGVEGALGAVWFVRAGLGLTGELVGDVFWGTGTRDRGTPAYPLLSAQAGLLVAYEVMP